MTADDCREGPTLFKLHGGGCIDVHVMDDLVFVFSGTVPSGNISHKELLVHIEIRRYS
jgi:hypothetical protein